MHIGVLLQINTDHVPVEFFFVGLHLPELCVVKPYSIVKASLSPVPKQQYVHKNKIVKCSDEVTLNGV